MRTSWKLGLAASLLFVAGCAAGSASPMESDAVAPRLRSEAVATSVDTTVVETAATTVAPPEPVTDLARATLATMTVEEKAGQLFMPVVWGHDATDVSPEHARNNEAIFGFRTPAEIVSAYSLGGVMYLRHNVLTADQLGAFSSDLQDVAETDLGVGLLVAVDQEGGRVNRITDGVTVFPPAAVLSGDSNAVEEAGYLTGSQVSVQGINVVLAPVADVTAPDVEGAIGNRSYGDDPIVVADMVSAAIGGLQSSGVAAAVKHWPGHGATQVDSHKQLPVLDITRTTWEERERLPFEAAIEQDVAIVLVGHLSLPAVDPAGTPATISPILIDEQLRGELGFEGVVMTDALEMGAVGDLDPGDVVIQSVRAGADIMLYPPDLPLAYDALITAVESGELSEDFLDEAVLRVLSLKDSLGLLVPQPPLDQSSEQAAE